MKHLALFLFFALCLLYVNNVVGRYVDKLVVREKIDRVGSLQNGGAGEKDYVFVAYGA